MRFFQLKEVLHSACLEHFARPNALLAVVRSSYRLSSRSVEARRTRSLQTSAMLRDNLPEYNWIDDVENLDMYKPGGYHPVMIDDVIQDRYRIVDKLGFGGYSTIWLAYDQLSNHYVAIKISIGSVTGPHVSRERRILLSREQTSLSQQHTDTAINGRDAIPVILDHFDIHGPNGIHSCYTVAPAQGSVKEASANRLFPIHVARILAVRLALAVSFIHLRGVVHGGLSRTPRLSHIQRSPPQ